MATRWGIVGTGRISHDFVTSLRTLPEQEHQVVAVAARNEEDAQAFATKHHISVSHSSYEDLARNNDAEVVYIGVVNTFHCSLGELMLNNGKHVLVEKPMGLSLDECRHLIALAKRKKRFLMEAIWSRFLPSYEHLMKELRKGSAGSVLNVSCSLGFPLSHVDNIRRLDLGGGGLLNLGIYCVNAVAIVYEHQWPEKIVALGHLNEEGVDDNLSVSLRYSGGRLASFTTSCSVTLPCELHIAGTKGTFKLPSLMCCPTKVHSNSGTLDFPLPTSDQTFNYENSVGLRYEAMEVRRCLLEGILESPKMSHAHSAHLHAIMGEICGTLGIVYKGRGNDES